FRWRRARTTRARRSEASLLRTTQLPHSSLSSMPVMVGCSPLRRASRSLGLRNDYKTKVHYLKPAASCYVHISPSGECVEVIVGIRSRHVAPGDDWEECAPSRR